MTIIDKAMLDQLLEGVDPANPQSMFTDSGLFGQLKKALAERMLQAELTHHLEQRRLAPEPTRNHKNGSSKKSVLAAETKLNLDIPRDRDGSFEPQLIAKHQRRLPGFDDDFALRQGLASTRDPGTLDRTLRVGSVARPDFNHYRRSDG
jgi:transposase-like protein